MDAYTRMALLCTCHMCMLTKTTFKGYTMTVKKNLSSNDLSSVHCSAKLLVEA
jgi:hypothetical protein